MKDKKVKERVAASESKILRQSYIDSVLEKEVTEQKVSAKYAEISSNLAGKKEYSIFHIVAKSKEEAEKIYKEITAKKKSIRFSDAAKKYSIDQESAERGGNLGFVLEDNMIKEIADAIVNLKQDEISAPIQTKFGWHLVKVVDIRDAKALPFEAVKDNIHDQLLQDTMNEVNSKITKDVKIKILTFILHTIIIKLTF
jgi:peptidyl-prolyl cis-trans isomerase C